MKKNKILIAGNMVNQGFVTARELRKRDMDVQLLMEKNPKLTADPAYLDPNLKNNYPDWINIFDKSNKNWKFEVIRIMKKFDLIHAFVEFPIFASFSGKPFISHSQGADFRELSTSKSLRGFLLRRAYKKSKIIIYTQPDYWKINEKILNEKGIFVPIIWDKTDWPRFEKTEKNSKLTIFHPANLDFIGKKNQIFIEGFEKFIKKFPEAHLIIVDRGIDSEKTHELVEKLKIKNFTEFVDGPLDKIKMAEFYSKSDIIADQFGVGSMGSVALESMIYEKPVIIYIDQESHRKSYGSVPPVSCAKTPSEVFDVLVQLKEEKYRIKIGKELRTWFDEYHSLEKITNRISTIYDSIEKGYDINKTREEISKNL